MIDRYAGAAAGWATGASRVYGPLAAALVATAPHPLAGRRVLDAGAGTGLASDALLGAGAHPIALDLSVDMLRWHRASRPPAVAGSVTAVPLSDGAVDDVVAAFVLNHTDEPVLALTELARVARPGGALLASVAENGATSPSRDRVDAVALAHGFSYPDWYHALKAEQAPLLGTVDAMAAAAGAAGLTAAEVDVAAVDVGVHEAADLVDYRLGQATFTTWLAGLSPRDRAAVREEAVAAVTPVMEPYRPRMVRLAGIV